MSYEDEAFKLAEVLDVLLHDLDGAYLDENHPVWQTISWGEKVLTAYRKFEKEDIADKATFESDYRSRHPEG